MQRIEGVEEESTLRKGARARCIEGAIEAMTALGSTDDALVMRQASVS
jgi:hypothetical protein